MNLLLQRQAVTAMISGVVFLDAHLTQWMIIIICKRHTTIVVVEAAVSSFLGCVVPATTWRGATMATAAMTSLSSLAMATTACTTTTSVGGISRAGP